MAGVGTDHSAPPLVGPLGRERVKAWHTRQRASQPIHGLRYQTPSVPNVGTQYRHIMPKGPSGKIVINLGVELKRKLYSKLALEGKTLKQWVTEEAKKMTK